MPVMIEVEMNSKKKCSSEGAQGGGTLKPTAL